MLPLQWFHLHARSLLAVMIEGSVDRTPAEPTNDIELEADYSCRFRRLTMPP